MLAGLIEILKAYMLRVLHALTLDDRVAGSLLLCGIQV